jgi:hypothetical protein
MAPAVRLLSQRISHVPQFTGISEQAPPLGRSVSIDQAARLLNVSRRTIYNRIGVGRVGSVGWVGGWLGVLVDSLQELGLTSPAFAHISGSTSTRTVQG